MILYFCYMHNVLNCSHEKRDRSENVAAISSSIACLRCRCRLIHTPQMPSLSCGATSHRHLANQRWVTAVSGVHAQLSSSNCATNLLRSVREHQITTFKPPEHCRTCNYARIARVQAVMEGQPFHFHTDMHR